MLVINMARFYSVPTGLASPSSYVCFQLCWNTASTSLIPSIRWYGRSKFPFQAQSRLPSGFFFDTALLSTTFSCNQSAHRGITDFCPLISHHLISPLIYLQMLPLNFHWSISGFYHTIRIGHWFTFKKEIILVSILYHPLIYLPTPLSNDTQ